MRATYDTKRCKLEESDPWGDDLGVRKVWDKKLGFILPIDLATKEKPPENRKGLEWIQFPAELFARAKSPAFALLYHLHAKWFKDWQHLNPLKLTRSIPNLTRGQRVRAIAVLEKSGFISVERRERKSPMVTLNWLPLKA